MFNKIIITPLILIFACTFSFSSSKIYRNIFTTSIENDMFFNYRGKSTDRGFTQGIFFEWDYFQSPQKMNSNVGNPFLFATFPSFFSGKYQKSSRGLIQTIYTPLKREQETVQIGDRPFNANLLIFDKSQYKLSSPISTTIIFKHTVGVMGRWALGEPLQNQWHEIINTSKFQGWDTQIRPQVLYNYEMELKTEFMRKSFFTDKALRFQQVLWWNTDLKLGLLNTSYALGGVYKIGYFNPDFDIDVSTDQKRKEKKTTMLSDKSAWYKNFTFAFRTSAMFRAVGYNANLQGGIHENWVKRNPSEKTYFLKRSEISNFIFESKNALEGGYDGKKVGLVLGYHISFRTKEFQEEGKIIENDGRDTFRPFDKIPLFGFGGVYAQIFVPVQFAK